MAEPTTFDRRATGSKLLEALGITPQTNGSWQWGSGPSTTINAGLVEKMKESINTSLHNAFLNTDQLDQEQMRNLIEQIQKNLHHKDWNSGMLADTGPASALAGKITVPEKQNNPPAATFKTKAELATFDQERLNQHTLGNVATLTDADGRYKATFEVGTDGEMKIDTSKSPEGKGPGIEGKIHQSMLDVMQAYAAKNGKTLAGSLPPRFPGMDADKAALDAYNKAAADFATANKELLKEMRDKGVFGPNGQTLDAAKLKENGVEEGEYVSMNQQQQLMKALKDLKDGDRTNDIKALEKLGISQDDLKKMGIEDPSKMFMTTKGSQILREAVGKAYTAGVANDGVLDEKEQQGITEAAKAKVAELVKQGGFAEVKGGQDVRADAGVAAGANNTVAAADKLQQGAAAAAQR